LLQVVHRLRQHRRRVAPVEWRSRQGSQSNHRCEHTGCWLETARGGRRIPHARVDVQQVEAIFASAGELWQMLIFWRLRQSYRGV
jgi:hypothetical protein